MSHFDPGDIPPFHGPRSVIFFWSQEVYRVQMHILTFGELDAGSSNDPFKSIFSFGKKSQWI